MLSSRSRVLPVFHQNHSIHRGRAVDRAYRSSVVGASGTVPSKILVMTRATSGAATLLPNPASSRTATMTYVGSWTGPNAANSDVSALPRTSAVPVFPARGYWSWGK